MTVGELVLERYALLSRGRSMGGVAGPQDVASMAITGWLRTLRSVGLWDAEVQEGMWDPEGGYTNYDLLQVWGSDKPPAKTLYGPTEYVRVIVLKGAEDDPA